MAQVAEEAANRRVEEIAVMSQVAEEARAKSREARVRARLAKPKGARENAREETAEETAKGLEEMAKETAKTEEIANAGEAERAAELKQATQQNRRSTKPAEHKFDAGKG